MGMEKDVTNTDIYKSDLEIIDWGKSIKQEPRRDSLHRLLVAGKTAIENAKRTDP